MVKIERILCPIDLSTESDEVLRYAVALARAYDAKLLLVYCTQIKSEKAQIENRHLSVGIALSFEQALIRHLGLAQLCDLNWEALAIENVQDVGEAITHQAKVHCADLIVMRSRRRPHAAVLLGSTAEKVSRSAPCPVLVTHPNEVEWVGFSTGKIDLRRVLVAQDFLSDSELAVKYGCSLAQEYRLNCTCYTFLIVPDIKKPRFCGQRRETTTTTSSQRANYSELFRRKHLSGARLLRPSGMVNRTMRCSLTLRSRRWISFASARVVVAGVSANCLARTLIGFCVRLHARYLWHGQSGNLNPPMTNWLKPY